VQSALNVVSVLHFELTAFPTIATPEQQALPLSPPASPPTSGHEKGGKGAAASGAEDGSRQPRSTLSFYTVIACQGLPSLLDLHSNFAAIAAIFCQNDNIEWSTWYCKG
jgi:hypothetical protein